MLFRLKRCVPFTQMRQFVMFHTNNTTQLKMKTIYHWGESKYSNIINPSLNVHRLLHSENQNSLSPLMSIYHKKNNTSEMACDFYILNLSIDPEFDLNDFIAGVNQAIMVISAALSTQDYEALNGMVNKKAIKILRHRVDRLTPRQRELLFLETESFKTTPYFIRLKRKRGNSDVLVQIGVYGICAKDNAGIISDLQFYYVFERMYKNGVGSEWIVRLVNYT